MKQQVLKMAFGLVAAGALFASCKKEDIVEENEEEVITTMKLTFVPVGGGATLTYQFDDPDGPGGTAATQDEIILAPSKVYNVTLQLLNKTETPIADITDEVRAENEAHRFYYESSAGIAVANLDNDVNGIPLGITSTWTTGAVATGTTKVTLRHYPGTPPDKAIGDLVTSLKSGTDIEVTFTTKVQ